MRLIFLLLITSTVSFAQGTLENKILHLSERKFVWMINKQLDSLEMMLDERVKYTHSNGWTESKPELLDNLKSSRLVYKNVQVDEATVRLYKNTAIVTGTGKFSGINNGNAFDLGLRYTEVYVLNKKKWLLASRHANRLP
ncbi:MAG: nuclear transport factor 2 family protein [Cyclobacteriaceae bacterium]|nr:nuclear transport factor 2 family protein [Cyclobacteriaceae bacterium]